jgi:hypothetical protein
MGPAAKLSALLLMFVLLLAANGCGGGNDETTATAAQGGSTPAARGEGRSGEAGEGEAAAKDTPPVGPEAEEAPAQGPRREARERAAYEHKRYGDPSPQSESFEKYSHLPDTSSATRGLHLAEFGDEADSDSRQAVSSVVSSYLAAIEGGNWERACASLSAGLQSQILAGTGNPSSCGEALHTAVSAFNEATGRKSISAPEGVASLRIETGGRAGEGAGFALLHGDDGSDYWLAVRREGGEWRLISLVPQLFTG